MGHMVHFTIAQASLQVLSAKKYEVMCMQVLTPEHLTYMHVHTGKGLHVRRFADIYAHFPVFHRADGVGICVNTL